MNRTREETMAYQRALNDFRASPIGAAFMKFENKLIRAWVLDTEDSIQDKNRVTTKIAHDDVAEARRELLTLLDAPKELIDWRIPR